MMLEPAETAAIVAGGAALLSSLAALTTVARQGRLHRRLLRLQAINIERREYREGLLLLAATSRVVSERGRDLQVTAKSNPTAAELRTKFEAFSAASEYLLQAWTAFSSRASTGTFGEIRESVSRVLESTEAARLGWLVLSSDGPPSSVHALAGYADTAAQWSHECQQMCATGAQAAGVVIDRKELASV